MTRISEGEKELTNMIKAATSRMMTLEKNLELQNTQIVDMQLKTGSNPQLAEANTAELKYLRDQINVLRGQ